MDSLVTGAMNTANGHVADTRAAVARTLSPRAHDHRRNGGTNRTGNPGFAHWVSDLSRGIQLEQVVVK